MSIHRKISLFIVLGRSESIKERRIFGTWGFWQAFIWVRNFLAFLENSICWYLFWVKHRYCHVDVNPKLCVNQNKSIIFRKSHFYFTLNVFYSIMFLCWWEKFKSQSHATFLTNKLLKIRQSSIWYAGSMGQMTHRPSIWCSKNYF